MARKKELNLHRDQKDWRGQRLCPLQAYTFNFDEHIVASIEGFMFTLRLPSNDNRRIATLMDDPADARRIARNLKLKKHAWWNNTKVDVESKAFERLFEQMMRARFRKDRHAIAALMASKGLKLVHKRPRRRTVLSVVPTKLYCKVLEGFRKELFSTGEIAKFAA